MKIKPESRTAHFIARVFPWRTWFDYQRVRGMGEYIVQVITRLFSIQTQGQEDSFKEVVSRLNLTEEALHAQQIGLLRLAWLMLFISFGIFMYAIYLFIYGTIHSGLVAIVISALAWILAFRYHFWYFQIKERRLGVSIKQWFRQGVLGKS